MQCTAHATHVMYSNSPHAALVSLPYTCELSSLVHAATQCTAKFLRSDLELDGVHITHRMCQGNVVRHAAHHSSAFMNFTRMPLFTTPPKPKAGTMRHMRAMLLIIQSTLTFLSRSVNGVPPLRL